MIRSFFKVTAWERASFARRLLCAFGRVFVLVISLGVVGYILFAHRYEIEAKVWHWRHGYSTTLENYEIPVPAHWVVLSQEDENLEIANTSPNRPRDDGTFYIAPVVTINVGFLSRPRAAGDAAWVSALTSLERKRLADEKVEPVMVKTLSLANETVSCIGGDELDAALVLHGSNLPRTHIISLHCMSDRGLDVLFVGQPPDVESFYTLLSQIRHRR